MVRGCVPTPCSPPHRCHPSCRFPGLKSRICTLYQAHCNYSIQRLLFILESPFTCYMPSFRKAPVPDADLYPRTGIIPDRCSMLAAQCVFQALHICNIQVGATPVLAVHALYFVLHRKRRLAGIMPLQSRLQENQYSQARGSVATILSLPSYNTPRTSIGKPGLRQ